MSTGQVSTIKSRKKWKEKNPEKVKKNRATAKKWTAENSERLNKQRQKRNKEIGSVCNTRKKQLKRMKNDPESLTKEFMESLFNSEFKC